MTDEEKQRIEEEFSALLVTLPNDEFGNSLRKVVAIREPSIAEKEFLLDQGADAKVHKVFLWADNTRENIDDIISGRGTIASATQLPVQIWVIVSEMADYFNRHYETSVELFPGFGITNEQITVLSSILNCISRLKDKFPEQELQTLELLRNYYSHLSISKYSIQWNTKSGSFARDLDGRSRREVKREIQEYLNQFGGDIRKISTDLANRIVPELDELYGLVKAWSQEGLLA